MTTPYDVRIAELEREQGVAAWLPSVCVALAKERAKAEGYRQAKAEDAPLLKAALEAQVALHNLHCVQAELKNLHYSFCHALATAIALAEGKAPGG